MSTIERTAFPRYSKRRKFKTSELNDLYTLTIEEIILMRKHARSNLTRMNFAIQLKVFQHLGYFISIPDVPNQIITHIRRSLKFHHKLGWRKRQWGKKKLW